MVRIPGSSETFMNLVLNIKTSSISNVFINESVSYQHLGFGFNCGNRSPYQTYHFQLRGLCQSESCCYFAPLPGTMRPLLNAPSGTR